MKFFEKILANHSKFYCLELLRLAVILLCLNCSKKGSPQPELEGETTVLEVNPALLNQQARRLPGALADIAFDDDLSEVKADSSSDVGSELLGRLNILSDVSVPLEEVEVKIQDFLDSLGVESFSQAYKNLHSNEQAAKLRNDARRKEIVKKYGGDAAVQEITKYKEDSEKLIHARKLEVEALVGSILNSKRVIDILFDSKESRAQEVQSLNDELRNIEATIQQTLIEQQKVYKTKIPDLKRSYDSLSSAIEATREQIGKVEAAYLKAIEKTKNDQNLWQVLWRTDSGLRREVLSKDATAKASWDLSQDRKKEMASLQEKREAVRLDWSTQGIQAATPPQELTDSLKSVRAKLASYQREVGYVFKEKEDLYRVGASFASLTQINEQIHSTLRDQKSKQLALAELDPVKKREDDGTLIVPQKDETLEEDLKRSSARVVQQFRNDIAVAFESKLKRYYDLIIDFDFSDADYQIDREKSSQQFLDDQEKVKQDNKELANRLKEVALCYRDILVGQQSQEALVDVITVDDANLLGQVRSDLSESELESVIYFLLDETRQIVSIQTQRDLKDFVSPLAPLSQSVYYLAVCTRLNDGTIEVQSKRIRFRSAP